MIAQGTLRKRSDEEKRDMDKYRSKYDLSPVLSVFASVGLKVKEEEIANGAMDIFQMDIVNRHNKAQNRFRIWGGEASVKVLDVDKKHKQVLLAVKEPSKTFESNVGTFGRSKEEMQKEFGTRLVFYDKHTSRIKKTTPGAERRILCGVDEGHYFISVVPGKPKTVAEAHVALTPKLLRNRKDYIRQGEWFFVPLSEKEYAQLLRDWPTNYYTNTSIDSQFEKNSDNYHYADEMLVWETNVVKTGNEYFPILVRGEIRHDRHKTIDLGDKWHLVLQNEEILDVDGIDFVD